MLTLDSGNFSLGKRPIQIVKTINWPTEVIESNRVLNSHRMKIKIVYKSKTMCATSASKLATLYGNRGNKESL